MEPVDGCAVQPRSSTETVKFFMSRTVPFYPHRYKVINTSHNSQNLIVKQYRGHLQQLKHAPTCAAECSAEVASHSCK